MRLCFPPFDPTNHYKVTRHLTINGVALKPGESVPPGTPSRVIEQLYELRDVVPEVQMAPAAAPQVASPLRPPMPQVRRR